MKTGAVIVTYNSACEIGACLDACQSQRDAFGAGIVVVDNASADGTAAEVRRRAGIQFIENSENRGFAAAVNQGFRALPDADAILVLNPDTHLLASPAALLDALAADPSTGAAGGTLTGDSGQPQTGFQVRRFPTPASLCFETLGLNRLFPRNPVNRRYRAADLDLTKPAWNVQPPGACLMIRTTAWRSAGGFDERFHPLWFEDVDFLARLTASGWRVAYVPEFRARHKGAHSIGSLRGSARHLYWYGNLIRYSSLHFGAAGRLLICGAVVAGVLPRTVTGMLRERSIQPAAVYGRLVRLALTYLWREKRPSPLTDPVSRRSRSVSEPAGSQTRPAA